MDGRVVEPEALRLFVGELGHVARIRVAITHPERYVRIAVTPAHVLIEERLRHEFGNARVASVGKRVLAYLVCSFGRYHFFQKFFIGLGSALYHLTVLEPQLDARDFVGITVERLIDAYPPVCTSPVRRGEDFKGW